MNKHAKEHKDLIENVYNLIVDKQKSILKDIDNDLIELDTIKEDDLIKHIINNKHHLEFFSSSNRTDMTINDLLFIFIELLSSSSSAFHKAINDKRYSSILNITIKDILKNSFIELNNKYPLMIKNILKLHSNNYINIIKDYYSGTLNLSDKEYIKSYYNISDTDYNNICEILRDF